MLPGRGDISRLRLVEIRGKGKQQSFRSAVDEGLSSPQKHLPTRFLYDHAGSELFERITELPEYYLTRCEAEIFDRYASQIVQVSTPRSIIEFGSGSSKKTRLLLDAAQPEEYVPIDISADFLLQTSNQLLEEYPGLCVTAVAGEYFDAAAELPQVEGPRLVLFLGSNIGNLTRSEAVEFLGLISDQLRPDDSLLVGVDLVKDPAIIEAAYNDAEGVTEAFNKNLLARVNAELDGNFDLDSFRHRAPYIPEEQRVEMRLYSLADQTVAIESLGKQYHLKEGEFIHTEWSHKYTEDSFAGLCRDAKLRICETWHDERNWFSTMILRRSA